MTCNPRPLGTSAEPAPRAILFELCLYNIIATQRYAYICMHVTTAPFRCVAREPHGFNSRATEGPFHRMSLSPSLTLSFSPWHTIHTIVLPGSNLPSPLSEVVTAAFAPRAQVGIDKEPESKIQHDLSNDPFVLTSRALTI